MTLLIIIGWLLSGWLGGRMAIQQFRREFPDQPDVIDIAILITITGPIGLVVAIIASGMIHNVISVRLWGVKEKDNVRTR